MLGGTVAARTHAACAERLLIISVALLSHPVTALAAWAEASPLTPLHMALSVHQPSPCTFKRLQAAVELKLLQRRRLPRTLHCLLALPRPAFLPCACVVARCGELAKGAEGKRSVG